MKKLSALALLSLLSASVAVAQTAIPIPGYDPFIPTITSDMDYVGTDGSANGYSADGWQSWDVGQGNVALYTLTDDAWGPWNGDNPCDDWLIWPETFQNGGIQTWVWQEDNDSIGVVANHNGSNSYYLFFGTRDSLPRASNGDPSYGSGQWRLYKVTSSGAQLLASTPCGGSNNPRCPPNSAQSQEVGLVGMQVVDGWIWAYTMDQNWNYVEVLSYTDPNPLPAGRFGIYAYDTGNSGGGSYQTAYLEPTAWRTDQDDDGEPDDSDCDPYDPSIYPGAPETCGDGIDQDCNGSDLICGPIDNDNDGYDSDLDCDDTDASIHPGAAEICGDGIDQDCDGADSICPPQDNDGDGYTDAAGDCDDTDASVHPNAVEVCDDGIDQDCNGLDAPCSPVDGDGDGYDTSEDCDDSDAGIHPGAGEICGDGIDQDCNGVDNPCQPGDQDGDGYNVEGGDCDDADNTIYPGAPELCGDSVDQDCDGAVDEGCAPAEDLKVDIGDLLLGGCGCGQGGQPIRGLTLAFGLLLLLGVRRRSWTT